ncbi:MAG TPA: VOC family protein [Vicinamibacteria bacterium]|jgi:predicted enzyme related to lactoylglutathione lyase
MKHPVVWFEVMGDNGERLRSFYGRLFDWKIDASNPMKYGLVEAANGRGIPGGVGQLDAKPYPKVTFYVSTDSVDRSLDKAQKLGGRVLMTRTQLPSGPVLGMFADPEGNAIGLVEEHDL